MAWRRPGDKPLSEPMMFSLLMHVCVTQLQWVNTSTGYNIALELELGWRLTLETRILSVLTQWGGVTHICVIKLTIIGSDNGLSPGRHQAIICTNAGILLIRPLGTNFIEILIGIQTFSFKKMHLKMSSAKWCPFCFHFNVLTHQGQLMFVCMRQSTRQSVV